MPPYNSITRQQAIKPGAKPGGRPNPNAAPSKDASGGQQRNEYIPAFISKKPFYVVDDDEQVTTSTSDADYLQHQRLQDPNSSTFAPTIARSEWYDRGRKLGPAATKYRKGACENCGAMSHKTKECLSRPRKLGAKWTGKDIQADEAVKNVQLGWDAKRDRWNGYDAREYEKTVKEFEEMENLKRAMRGEGLEKDGKDETDAGGEGDRYEEETDMGREQGTSTRNLRIREDTAKYLLNLDLESARYDPKTRSMIDAGTVGDGTDAAAKLVAEEGFAKMGGQAGDFEKATRAAWEANEKGEGAKLHLQANPTESALLRKKQEEASTVEDSQKKKKLLDLYGAQDQYTKDQEQDLGVVESERYVEYDERGVIKNAKKVKARSQYPEDVLINNHTSVWGSWWKNFRWGYACCHSTDKQSYCLGEEGKAALAEEEAEPDTGNREISLDPEEDSKAVAHEVPREIAWKEEERLEKHVPNGVDSDQKATKDKKQGKKRPAEKMHEGVTEAQMDEYRRKRMAPDDPMKNMLGADEVVH